MKTTEITSLLATRQVMQIGRGTAEERHKFSYFAMKDSFAGFVRAFLVFKHVAGDVKWPVLQLCGRALVNKFSI